MTCAGSAIDAIANRLTNGVGRSSKPAQTIRVASMAMVGAAGHEPRIRQGAQLERHRAERHIRHRGMDLSGGALGLPHQPQDLAAAWRGEGGQNRGVEHVLNLDQTKMKGNRNDS